ncbi:hypothetical protein MMC08_004336 [Hypocenomyce scalaris]|nr:hypothetical protein [Hypocenomyce scalaris]
MPGLHKYPSNIGAVRARLFALEEPVILSVTEFEVCWPHVDNVWKSTGTVRVIEGCRTEYFCCRRASKEDWMPQGGGKRVRKRQKPSHTAIGCPVTMRVVHHAGVVTVDRLREGEASGHVHTLDNSDCFKQPFVFCALAAREVANDYAVAVVARNLCEVNSSADQRALFAAGGRWLSLKDIHNACTA